MNINKTLFSTLRVFVAIGLVSLLGACAHPITIPPLETPIRDEAKLISKNVAYVMTEADRKKQVITPGGGGDKISYYPYLDLEKSIRDALRAVYKNVSVIPSPSNTEAIKANDIKLIFTPEISTTSSSESLFTWPPTKFSIEITLNVTDPKGSFISRIRVIGNGEAEFEEFKTDLGLAGRRASTELSQKLKKEIAANPQLQ
jgi:hypothetical protein